MINFISFADGSIHFRRAVNRIRVQALKAGIFNTVNCYTLSTLKKTFPNFFDKHGKFLLEEPRAIGRWIWKPFLCAEFAKLSGDYLYLDAGSHLNLNFKPAVDNFYEYFKMLDESPVVSFQIRENQYYDAPSGTEKVFSRDQLLDFCDPKREVKESNQIEANAIFFRAGEISQAFFNEILDVATYQNYFFLRSHKDESNLCPSKDLYRYDQSIFSLLYKKRNFKLVENETWFHPNWKNLGKNFPIWTVRNRTGIDIFKFRIRDIPERLEVKYRFWLKIRNKIKFI